MANNDLANKLSNVLAELQQLMQQRRERVIELQAEIESIEAENERLQQSVEDMLKSFE